MGLDADTSNTDEVVEADDTARADVSALDQLLKRTGTQPDVGATPLSRLLGGRISTPAAIGLLAIAVAVGWAAWHLLARPAPIEERMPMAGEASVGAEQIIGDGGDTAGGADSTSPSASEGVPNGAEVGVADLVVHVAGAVASPGVVDLRAGSRVEDALAAAGGPAAGADLERLNLAAPLVDGARLYVPAIGEQVPPELTLDTSAPAGSSGPSGADSVVNINSADVTELETLPGVGPATAAAILEHRERNGRFETVEALLKVRGIGEAKLAAIADLVAVG